MHWFWLILAILAFLIAVGAIIATLFSDAGVGGVVTAVAATLVGVLFIVLSSATVVGARNIGVVTTFGAVHEETLDPGLHWKAPWSSVTDMDGTIQTTKYVGKDGCIGVRIADGQTACVSVVERHRTRIDAADDLYVDYRKVDEQTDGDINDAINDSLVRTQLTQGLGQVFGDFDPLTDAGLSGEADPAAVTADDAAQGVDYTGLSTQLVTALNDRLKAQSSDGRPQVEVISATITFVYFADVTQDRINQYQAEVAKTRIAEQRKATAEAEAAANRELSASVSNDPNVLVSKCLDLAAEGVKVGFSCWPFNGAAPTLTAPVR